MQLSIFHIHIIQYSQLDQNILSTLKSQSNYHHNTLPNTLHLYQQAYTSEAPEPAMHYFDTTYHFPSLISNIFLNDMTPAITICVCGLTTTSLRLQTTDQFRSWGDGNNG